MSEKLNAESGAGLAAASGYAPWQPPFRYNMDGQWIEDSVKFCHCAAEHKPCDGVLSGGICDMNLETRRWEFCDE